jgi:O-antigen/teichoic acid export membrane protein
MFLDSPLRQLLRNSGWLFTSDATVLAADLLVTVLVARALGAADFGRLGLVWTVVGTVNLLVDVRAWEATTRYLSEFTARDRPGLALATLKLVVLVEAAVAVAGFALAWATSGPVAAWLGDRSLRPLIVLGALTLVVTALDRAAGAVLRVFDRFRALGLCQTLWAVGRLVLIAGVLGMGARVRGVVLAHVVADAGAAVVLLTVAGRAVRARLWTTHVSARLGLTRPYWREMLTFVGHSSLRATLKVASRRLDVLLLGHYRSKAEVGVYQAALRLAQLLEELGDPLYFAAFPQFARAWVEARPEYFELLRRMVLGLAVLATASVLVGVLGAPLLIGVALGPAYAPAVVPFRPLVVACGIALATLWATPAALGSGQPAVETRAATSGVVCLAVLLAGLIPVWGATGAAWARLGGALASGVIVGRWLGRMLRQPAEVASAPSRL